MAEKLTQRPDAAQAEALWRRWKVHGDIQARDRLIFLFTPLVRHLAYHKLPEAPSYFEIDDLMSCGLIALITAVDRFKPEKGATFEQYAWTCVAGAIIDELRRQHGVSRVARRMSRQIESAREGWLVKTGRAPSEKELARELEIDVPTLRKRTIELDRAKLVSLNAPARGRDEMRTAEIADTIEAPESEASPESSVLSAERAAVLSGAIAGLSERERAVLALLHVHHLQGAEIGRMLGVSESRVSQMLTSIRTRLRGQLDAYEKSAL